MQGTISMQSMRAGHDLKDKDTDNDKDDLFPLGWVLLVRIKTETQPGNVPMHGLTTMRNTQ